MKNNIIYPIRSVIDNNFFNYLKSLFKILLRLKFDENIQQQMLKENGIYCNFSSTVQKIPGTFCCVIAK